MFAFLLIAVFGVVTAFAQASYGSESFKYWGCATIDTAGFSQPIELPTGTLSPSTCQAACAGHLFAAVSPDACRCGNDHDAVEAADEDSCNHPCFEDSDSPMCGGICPEGTPSISNLFIIDPPVLADDDDAPPQPNDPGNPPVPSSGVLIPPAPEQSAASAALPEEASQPPPEPSLPVTQVTQTPPPPVEVSELPPETVVAFSLPLPEPVEPPASISVDGPEPTIPVPSSSFPSTDILSEDTPPMTSAPDPSIPTAEAPSIPPQSSTGPILSETLLTETIPAPVPSTPTGDGEPVPSQVRVSDSGHFEIPVLTALGELLLIVVMAA
ncbi:hypothetical protein ACJ41O_003857 [Fusarium nematophilum]